MTGNSVEKRGSYVAGLWQHLSDTGFEVASIATST